MTAVAAPSPAAGQHAATTMAGVLTLTRFMLRSDRIRIPAWVLGLLVFSVGTASNLATLYASPTDRATIAATMDSPAGIAMIGENYGGANYHFGVMMGHQMLPFTVLLAGLMSILLIVRHTRLEEATGRAELVRAGVVGRHAMTAAAVVTVATANLTLGVLLAVTLPALGLEGMTSVGGSWLYGMAHVAVGMTFAAVAVVTVQITEHSRGASGMAIGILGASYGLRAVGDVSNPALSWLSPVGWAQATHVYVDDRWWALLPAVGVTVLLAAAGVALSSRRDLGAGLRQPRPGAPGATAALANPVGFALRLHRANLVGWSAGLFLLGAMYGAILGDAEQMLANVEGLEGLLPEAAGLTITDAFAGVITTVLAIFSAIYAVLAALKVRAEESSGRAEPLLAAAVSQPRWLGSHLVAIAVGSMAVLAAAGLGIGLAGAASLGDVAIVPTLLGAAVSYAPAVWTVAAVAIALFGLAPRLMLLTWALVLYSFVVNYLGGLLQFPEWTRNLSPYGHVPQQPIEPFAASPLLALTLLAGALAVVGIVAFRRRDLQSAT